MDPAPDRAALATLTDANPVNQWRDGPGSDLPAVRVGFALTNPLMI